MTVFTVFDPGHGGTAPRGRSTPFGVRGPGGLLEKDVTLEIARGVAQRLGGNVHLTRSDDVNLGLGERAFASRERQSPTFVSLHANSVATRTSPGPARGAETWLHPGAGPESIAMAEIVRGELARLGAPDNGLRRGALAVLDPRLHAPRTAACLVEVDYLDDPEGAARLADPRQLDALAEAVSRAVERFLDRGEVYGGRRVYSFGRGPAAAPVSPRDPAGP